jgi:hypothetical protein
MKQETINYEILLLTGTSFASREFCSRDGEKDNAKKPSAIEQLEEACWAGMLFEILPELVKIGPAKNESFIWNVMAGKIFLCISIGSSPLLPEEETSIDPYLFRLSTFNN